MLNHWRALLTTRHCHRLFIYEKQTNVRFYASFVVLMTKVLLVVSLLYGI